jgi:hypothetical protein
MLPDLGIFEKNLIETGVHGLALFYGSLKVTHNFFIKTYPYSTSPALMAYVEFNW